MESRRQLHLASLMFDVININNPDYLYRKLKFLNARNVPRAFRPPLVMYKHRTVAFTGSFRYQATKCWNNIPPPLRKLTSKCPCCEESNHGTNYLECKCCHSRQRRHVRLHRYSHQMPNFPGPIKSRFGPQCSMRTFAVVNQTYVTLFSSPDRDGFTTHPLTEEWECRMETAYNIKKYNKQNLVAVLQTYERNITIPAFKTCDQSYSGEEYCFCCKMRTLAETQGSFESIGYWDDRYRIYPLPNDRQRQFEAYWMYSNEFLELGSGKEPDIKDEILANETTTTAIYPDEEDYYDYINEYNEDDELEANITDATKTLQPTTTTNPSFQVNIEVSSKKIDSTTIISTVMVDQEQVLDELEGLLQGESPIAMTSMECALDRVDSLLDEVPWGPNSSKFQVNSLFEAENASLSGELLQTLDRLGPRVNLEGSQSAMIVRDNLALIVVEPNQEHPVKGLRITTEKHNAFNKDCFDFITGEDYSQYLASNESDAIVSLPSYVTDSNSRMSFVIFRDDRAFQHSPGRSYALVNSRILSVNVENVTKFEGEGIISLYLRPTKSDIGRNLRRACAYWQFLDDSTGFWSEEGCTFVTSSNGFLDVCQCDHLTHFAEVLITVNKFSELHEFILEVLSITGCCLSILGILLVVVTAFVFKSWRTEFSNKVWLQLCFAILIFNGCFLVITFVHFDQDIWCMIVGVTMHYSLLVSFFWMLVAAIISYASLVLVFKSNVTRKLLKSSLFAWGSPLLIIGTLLSINYQSYMSKFEDTSRNSSFCYPSGLSLWLTVYLPLAVILLINWSLFTAILRSMFASRKIRRHGNSKDSLRSAVVSSLLVFLFGLPWIFGLIAYNIIAAYIFTVTTSLQGFVLFIFFVVANKRTRDLWIRKMWSEKGRSMPVSMTTESTSGRAGSSVEMTAFGGVKLRESDEIKSLLQKGALSKSEYTRPGEKPDEYYE